MLKHVKNTKPIKLFIFCLSFILLLLNLFLVFVLFTNQSEKNPINDIRELMHGCLVTGWTDECYKSVSKNLLSKYSHEQVLLSLLENEKENDIFVKCHTVTHHVGRSLYEKYQSIPDAYKSCNSACWGGCYHGVLESYLLSKDYDFEKESEVINEEILSMCSSQKGDTTSRIYYECVHGIGHAVMFVSGMDIKRSLRYCDVLAQKDEQDACYGGVFMEYSSSSTESSHKVDLPNDDILYPCSVLEEKYLSVCYQYQSSFFMLRENADWKRVINDCNLVPDPYKSNCFLFVGTNQAGFTTDTDVALSNCEMINDSIMKTECLRGVVIGNGARYVNDMERLLDICEQIPDQYQMMCIKESFDSMRLWGWEIDRILSSCLEKYDQTLCNQNNI